MLGVSLAHFLAVLGMFANMNPCCALLLNGMSDLSLLGEIDAGAKRNSANQESKPDVPEERRKTFSENRGHYQSFVSFVATLRQTPDLMHVARRHIHVHLLAWNHRACQQQVLRQQPCVSGATQ